MTTYRYRLIGLDGQLLGIIETEPATVGALNKPGMPFYVVAISDHEDPTPPTPPPQAKREHEWTDDGDTFLVRWDHEKNEWATYLRHGGGLVRFCSEWTAKEIAKLAGLTPPEGE